MAEYHVSTWTDFKARIRDGANGDIIYLDADIDGGASPFTERLEMNSLTIEGQNHYIYGISCFTNVPCFFKKNLSEINWKNVHFANIFTTASTVFSGTHTSTSGGYGHFINCTFQGRWNYLIAYHTLDKCYIKGGGKINGTSSGAGIEITNCYIDINYTRDTTAALNYVTTFENNYITGNVYMEESEDNTTIFASQQCAPSTSVFNIHVKADSAHTYRWIPAYTTGYSLSIYNRDRLENVTISSADRMTALTDSEMKDAQAIAATGFPIVI